MADRNQDRPVELGTEDARGASTPGIGRYVLAASLVLVVIVMIAIYYIS